MLGFLHQAWEYIRDRYMWVLTAVWVTIFIESASRGDWGEALRWSFAHLPLLLLNMVLVGCLLALVMLPTGHARVAFWVVAGATVVLGAASGIKLKLMGKPLLPWDFAVAGEAAEVINWADILSATLVVGLVAFIIGSGLLLHKVEVLPRKVSWKARAVPAAVAAVLLAVLLFTPPGAVARAARGDGTPWDQASHVRTDGFLLSLLDNVRFMAEGLFSRTTKGDVSAFLPTDPRVSPDVGTNLPAPEAHRSPNVILVLSESFWDPTRLPKATFSEDPVPFFHSLQAKYPNGYMLSPEFAGSTANVELEVLTGLSMKLLPDGVLAYEKYINRPVDSLGAIFARNGYESTAISPWASWFFNSKQVYRNFGFGKFISIDFMKQEYNSAYLADAEVARNIVAEARKTPGPDFVFANTAENHYDYSPGKFKHTEITVSGVSDEAKGILETYAQGCRYADRMLQTLVEEFSKSGEPTLIVFFGDHLPLLGKNYAIYKEAGYLAEQDPDFLEKIYRVPVVTWNNYLPERAERLDFGTTFLGPYMLQQAGVTGTPVTEYLRDLSARVKEVPPRRYWEKRGIAAADMQNYEALQNDILFGEQKAYAEFKDRIVNPGFHLGYGPIAIQQVLADGAGVRITGQNLPPGGTVLINGKRAATMWESYDRYSVIVPAEVAAAATWEVQVKVFDLQYPEEAVAESPTVIVPRP
ncbi:MAG TPA: LTA synthase family protein [Symbiobacteriaceae bacterium]|nr:LTA synthase family protein [Symbiobacteriaceae bacterium]